MLSVHRAFALLPILSLVATGQALPASWDSVKMIAPGTEVRIGAVNSKPVQGKLESVADTTLVIKGEIGTRSFARPEIRSVSIKKKNHRLRKVLIGMGVGTAGGLGIGAAASNGCHQIACGAAETVIGGVIGLAGGVVAGLVWSRGEWRQVYTQ
jgi:hypothetical protein